jgi:hypothetical protein
VSGYPTPTSDRAWLVTELAKLRGEVQEANRRAMGRTLAPPRGTFTRGTDAAYTATGWTNANWTASRDLVGLTWSSSTSPQNVTIVTPGLYAVGGTVQVFNNNPGRFRDVQLLVNGTQVRLYSSATPDGSQFAIIPMSTTVRTFAAGDVLALQTQGNDAGNLLGGTRSFWSIVRIGD